MSIEISSVTKSFMIGKNKAEVLKGIDLTVNDGEMTAVIGSSGAGKSTLLNIIGCLDKADGGKYLLDGADVSGFSASQLAEIRNSRFGFVMQDFALIEDESVMQNIEIPALFSKTKKRNNYVDLLKRLGISKLADRKVSLLSGGEKQRVAIARALVNDPKYIIADEPTGALDTENSKMIMKILSELNSQGKTVIIVTHDPVVAAECSRVIKISDGKIVSDTDKE